MDQHYGYIDANRGYTYAELAQILEFAKDDGMAVKLSTVRNALKKLGCRTGRLGRTPIVPGRLLLLALERDAMSAFGEEGDDDDE